MKIVIFFGRSIGIVFAIFIFLIAYLQLQDGYVGYGYTSVALGLISTILVYRSFRNAR